VQVLYVNRLTRAMTLFDNFHDFTGFATNTEGHH
jgi:hypothetical protein